MNHFPTSSTTTCSTIDSSKEIIKIKKKRSSSSSSSSSSSCGHKIKGVMRLSTDPQSVAARERRHRISDRFKILQSLVPGGSKMDTVSMLEEAIHYVKYLKTQIWLHQNLIIINNNSHQHHHHDHDHRDDDHGHTMFLTPPDHHQSTISATTLYDVPAQVVQPQAVMAHDDDLYYYQKSFQSPETTSFDSISCVKF